MPLARPFLLLPLLVLGTACDETKSTAAPSSDPAKPAKPAKPANPDGVPGTIDLVPGGTFVTKSQKGDHRVWSYTYAAIEPRALAEKQRAAFEQAGWKATLRTTAVKAPTDPQLKLFASRDDAQMAIVEIAGEPNGASMLRLLVQPMYDFQPTAPAGYPAGFPFLPYGILYRPKTPPTTPRISFVYDGEFEALRKELAAVTARAGWDCGSFYAMTPCRKDGRHVLVNLSSLSLNRQSMIVSEVDVKMPEVKIP